MAAFTPSTDVRRPVRERRYRGAPAPSVAAMDARTEIHVFISLAAHYESAKAPKPISISRPRQMLAHEDCSEACPHAEIPTLVVLCESRWARVGGKDRLVGGRFRHRRRRQTSYGTAEKYGTEYGVNDLLAQRASSTAAA